MVFGKEPQDNLIGNYISCYIGHSNDLNIRYNSSSGGLVTQLLIFALEEGIINGALVTKMNPVNPLEPEVFVAKTKDDIISASKSKYCPVPANIALRQILRDTGKFATVGLSCHVEGIRKAEATNTKLAKKIVLHLGLICNHSPTFSATTYLLQRMHLKKEDIGKIDYRGEGWPGGMLVTLKNGNKRFVEQFNPFYWGHVFNSCFLTTRCALCGDKICELSDISFGDAWNLSNSKVGESIAISRNMIGEKVLKEAQEKKEIEIKQIKRQEVLLSQGLHLVKRRQKARTLVIGRLGNKTPVYNQKLLESRVSDYIEALTLYLQMSLSSKSILWSLVSAYPSITARIKGYRIAQLSPGDLITRNVSHFEERDDQVVHRIARAGCSVENQKK
jgi:coenzyme F420 hydrogenase subunit beta